MQLNAVRDNDYAVIDYVEPRGRISAYEVEIDGVMRKLIYVQQAGDGDF